MGPKRDKPPKVLTSLYVEPDVHQALKALSERTRVPIAVYLREGITDLLAKYSVKVGKAKK